MLNRPEHVPIFTECPCQQAPWYKPGLTKKPKNVQLLGLISFLIDSLVLSRLNNPSWVFMLAFEKRLRVISLAQKNLFDLTPPLLLPGLVLPLK